MLGQRRGRALRTHVDAGTANQLQPSRGYRGHPEYPDRFPAYRLTAPFEITPDVTTRTGAFTHRAGDGYFAKPVPLQGCSRAVRPARRGVKPTALRPLRQLYRKTPGAMNRICYKRWSSRSYSIFLLPARISPERPDSTLLVVQRFQGTGRSEHLREQDGTAKFSPVVHRQAKGSRAAPRP
ncbi:hypothetical protein BH23GEM6_BH23GEM6_01080 [soil metagenome]